jgi:predicted nucleic acid-binding protein
LDPPERSGGFFVAAAPGAGWRIPVSDALYVELARRTDSVLASLDDAMLRAAVSEGIAVLDGPDRPEPFP